MNESLFIIFSFPSTLRIIQISQNSSEGGILPSPPSILQIEKPGLEKKEASHGDTGTMQDNMCGMSWKANKMTLNSEENVLTASWSGQRKQPWT